jgi:hypothetical protein
MSQPAIKSEAYLDIVWRQFRKNRAALLSLRLLVPVFLVAIFAPLLASNQPLVFRAGEETIFPWFRALFNPGNTVDYVYNMALVGFIPWLALAIATNVWLRRRGISGPYRSLVIAGGYVVVILLFALLFLIPGLAPRTSSIRARSPRNSFRERAAACLCWLPSAPSSRTITPSTSPRCSASPPISIWNRTTATRTGSARTTLAATFSPA